MSKNIVRATDTEPWLVRVNESLLKKDGLLAGTSDTIVIRVINDGEPLSIDKSPIKEVGQLVVVSDSFMHVINEVVPLSDDKSPPKGDVM